MNRPGLPALGAGHSFSDPSSWAGSAAIGLGWGYFCGNIGDNQPHQHHAMQIVLAHAPLQIWLEGVGWLECHGLVIGPGVAHQLVDIGLPMKMIYLEPEDDRARRIAKSLNNGWRELSRDEAFGLWERLEQAGHREPMQVVVDLFDTAATDRSARRNDALIQKLLHDLPRPLPEKITAQHLARGAHLSPSRFQHRFAQHTGMALRPYLRWLRLLTALTAISRGDSLTQAAFDAGFADSAHFSRTFRRNFGFAPRHLLQIRFLALSTE